MPRPVNIERDLTMRCLRAIPWLVLPMLAACGGVEPEQPVAGGARTQFVDIAHEAGIDVGTRYVERRMDHILDSTGTGAAIADYDGDGDEDIYLVGQQTTDEWLGGQPPRPGALYRNDGGGAFTDVAADAGVGLAEWVNGAYFLDYDNDGDKDLYLTLWGPDRLYRNEGDGTFSDVSEGSGLQGAEDGWSSSAAIGDLDGDGDLDIYVTKYCEYDPKDFGVRTMEWVWKNLVVFPGPRGLQGQEDELYRNNGDGTFTDVSAEAGIREAPPLYALAAVMADFDDDGDADIYVANDSVVNLLWRNDGDLRFTEVGGRAGVATNEDAQVQAGMGTDAADYDEDGDLDLFVTNFSHDWNTLYGNDGDWVFSDATFKAGLRDSYLDLVWGTKFFDYDNDGWLDLVVANGHIYPQVDGAPRLNTSYRQANSIYRNLGDGTFENVTDSAGPGFAIVEGTRGIAVSDIDRDGDLDLFMSNLDHSPNLLINRGENHGNWISVELVGTESDSGAVGAKLLLTAGDRTWMRYVNPFGSYLSSSSYAVHFGLGSAERADGLEIHWPSGAVESVDVLEAGRFYTITEGRGVTAIAEP